MPLETATTSYRIDISFDSNRLFLAVEGEGLEADRHVREVTAAAERCGFEVVSCDRVTNRSQSRLD